MARQNDTLENCLYKLHVYIHKIRIYIHIGSIYLSAVQII